MKIPNFRIARLMVIIALVALEFTAVRAIMYFHDRDGATLLALGALPMANVLAAGLLIGYRNPRSRRFLLGFEVFGAMALAVLIASVVTSRYALVFRYLMSGILAFRRTFGRPLVIEGIDLMAPIMIVVMLVLPPLAFALIGGFLARSFRTTERRG